jgi:DNA-binding transcriptional ArsR family regulator
MSTSDDTAATGPRAITSIVPDATALKALAHPLRLRMLGILRIDGPATATQLASRLGLNSGATSYHLRQLALHGFIEDEPGDSRRDRWWRARHEATSFFDKGDDGAALDAGVAFTQAALSWQVAQMQSAIEHYASLPLAWRQASTASDYTIPLTHEAAKALTDKIQAILWEAMQAAPPLGQPLPEGTVPYTVIFHGFPYPGRGPEQDDDAP